MEAESEEMAGPGFGVTVLGRAGLRYREGSRTVVVDGELLTGPFDFVVYKDSIKVWDGSDEGISDDEKARIVNNIEAAFRSKGLAVTFE